MRKISLSLVVLAAIVLTACKTPSATPEATSAPTQPVAENAAAAPTPLASKIPADCTVSPVLPEPDPAFVASLPPVTEQDWMRGPITAPITIIEYTDYQCPYCSQLAPVLAQLSAAYPETLRIVVRDLPLNSIHDKASLAAQAAHAAGLQGKFFEFHDALYEKQAEWSQKTVDDFKLDLSDMAAGLGLDVAKFESDLTSDAVVKMVNDSLAAFEKTGLEFSTPNLIINYLPYGGRNDLESLKGLVKLMELPARGFTACPPMVIDTGKTYTATLKTTKGDIVIDLFADKAPTTVNSFVYLAQQGWFDNAPFHRVIAGFVAQTGDPSGTGLGSPGFNYGVEIQPDLGFDKAGVVGMARGSDPASNGSQFFITLDAVTDLSGQYTVFGQVTSGLDVVSKLTLRDAQRDAELAEPDLILSVTITEK